MIKINDRWFRILVILLPALVIAITSHFLVPPVTSTKIASFLVSVVSIILVCEGGRWIIYKSRQLSFNSSSLKRNLFVISIGLLFTTMILACSKLLRVYINTGTWDVGTRMESQVYVNGNQITIGLFSYSFMNAIFNFLFLYILYEVLYHYAKLRHTEKMKDVLEREKLKAELQQLKGIINPHFLFNNLNSLSSLIAENPAQAESFLDELTKVFRYLLRNNETELTTLANELQFIRSYYHLLQTRYGNSIQLDMNIDRQQEQLMLPPLTLQLLIENVVKHNSLQKDKPVNISLFSANGNKLIIRNNLEKKDSMIESTGIGLQNINARYRMLNCEGIITDKDERYFSVTIPLMKPQA